MKFAIHGPMCSGKTTISEIIKGYDSEYKTYSFGGKVKDIAGDLFKMEGKDRSLLISVASKMREIDPDVWAKYVVCDIEREKKQKCIIDDLRFQNEADYLKDWTFISLTTPKNVRIERIKNLYPENYEDHIKNMNHISETYSIKLPENTIYIDTSIPYTDLKKIVIDLMC
jgi:cytidylate kinase